MKLIKLKKLTPKKQLFVSEYLKDFNGTRAVKAAGYSAKTASSMAYELLRKPEIIKAVSDKIDEIIGKTDDKVAEVIKDLREIKDRCMQSEKVMEWCYIEKKMIPTGEYEFDSKGALKAIELIGKYLSMWSDKLELGKGITIIVEGKDKDL